MSSLSPETLSYLNIANLDHRKKLGQYFTVKSVRNIIFNFLNDKRKNLSVLELNCGTGEFIGSFYEHFDSPVVHGYDIDQPLVDLCKKQYPQANLECCDSLAMDTDKKYDYVIGNPPYFEYQPANKIKKQFEDVIKGRVNIYGLFIKKGIDLLKEDGVLAFVVPPSMNSGAYFSKLRQYIVDHCDIVFMKILSQDLFEDAEQTVQVIILKKGKNTGKYLFKKNGVMLFLEDYQEYINAYKSSTSLRELGFKVKTGPIVWNQNKDKLVNVKCLESCPLIWSENIKNNCINLTKKENQWIKNPDTVITEKTIAVKRIIGIGAVNIEYALIDFPQYQAENHVNLIFTTPFSTITLELLLELLNNKKSIELIKKISGNTQLSKNELENLFPIFLNE